MNVPWSSVLMGYKFSFLMCQTGSIILMITTINIMLMWYTHVLCMLICDVYQIKIKDKLVESIYAYSIYLYKHLLPLYLSASHYEKRSDRISTNLP